MNRARRLSSTLIAAFLVLSACMPTLESDEAPHRVYWLEATPPARAGSVTVVPRVSVVPGLETDQINILQSDGRLSPYAGAFWPDSLRPLLQSILERALEPAEPAPRSVSLQIEIERFFAVETPGSDIPRVELQARIRNTSGDSRVCLFEALADPDSNRLRDIVRAHQRLLEELVGELNRIASSDPSGGCG